MYLNVKCAGSYICWTWDLQYQCHAPKDKKDFAALASETGSITTLSPWEYCIKLIPWIQGMVLHYDICLLRFCIYIYIYKFLCWSWFLFEGQGGFRFKALLFWVFVVRGILFFKVLGLSSLIVEARPRNFWGETDTSIVQFFWCKHLFCFERWDL